MKKQNLVLDLDLDSLSFLSSLVVVALSFITTKKNNSAQSLIGEFRSIAEEAVRTGFWPPRERPKLTPSS